MCLRNGPHLGHLPCCLSPSGRGTLSPAHSPAGNRYTTGAHAHQCMTASESLHLTVCCLECWAQAPPAPLLLLRIPWFLYSKTSSGLLIENANSIPCPQTPSPVSLHCTYTHTDIRIHKSMGGCTHTAQVHVDQCVFTVASCLDPV